MMPPGEIAFIRREAEEAFAEAERQANRAVAMHREARAQIILRARAQAASFADRAKRRRTPLTKS